MEAKGRLLRFVSWSLTLVLVGRSLTRSRQTKAPEETEPAKDNNQPPSQTLESQPEPRAQLKAGLAGKFRLVSKAIRQFIDDDCTTMAAALAYYTTFSIAPLLLIVISIAGLIFGRQAVQHQIESQIQGLIGQGAASQISGMLKNAAEHSSTGIVGAILGGMALLVGATGSFAQLQASLNQIWHVKPDPRVGGLKNFIGQRILSLSMILTIAFLLLVSLAVNAALAAFEGSISSLLPQGFSHFLLMAASFVLSLAIIAVLFAAMFKVLPDAKIRWRDVSIGAGITAVLFTIGKFLIGIYLGRSGTASAYGAAGSFVLIVLWIYYSSLIVLFGTEFTTAWVESYCGPIQPKRGAVKIHTEEKAIRDAEPRRAA